MSTHTHKHHKSAKLFGLNRLGVLLVLAIAALLALLYINYLLMQGPTGSPEVAFTDASAHGMEIVPASCASAPPTAPSNGAGYYIYNGLSNAGVIADGYDFCVTDSGGATYFVPLNSSGELGSFYNAINAGHLPGVSQSADTGGGGLQ